MVSRCKSYMTSMVLGHSTPESLTSSVNAPFSIQCCCEGVNVHRNKFFWVGMEWTLKGGGRQHPGGERGMVETPNFLRFL
jgi:hypothetical protein